MFCGETRVPGLMLTSIPPALRKASVNAMTSASYPPGVLEPHMQSTLTNFTPQDLYRAARLA